jgi:hypothetical protein
MGRVIEDYDISFVDDLICVRNSIEGITVSQRRPHAVADDDYSYHGQLKTLN